MTAVADIERRIVRRAFRPPPRMNACEWADTFLYLPSELSAQRGPKYSSANAPYQREPLKVMSSPKTRRVALMWASQLGKSLILQTYLGWRIDQRPRPILMVQPTIELAEAWSKERLAPVASETPVLRNKLSDPKSRAGGNTLRLKLFDGGFLAIVGSNAPGGLAGRSIGDVALDEIDRFEESAGTEGDAIALAERRQAVYGDKLTLLTSTPGNKGESRIEPEFQAGDQRYYVVPCPHCGHEQELLWGAKDAPYGLRWDHDKPDTAQYLCAGCAALIDEMYKPWMLARGRWVPRAPDHPFPSFFLNGLYSPFGGSGWASHVETFLRDRHNPQKLKVFANTVWCETWEEPGARIESHELVARLEEYPKDAKDRELLPPEIAVLTAGVDVQGDRLELRVWGWGAGETSWLVRVEQIPGDPGLAPGTRGSPWDVLDEIRRQTYRHASGARLHVDRWMIDSGYHTKQVYQYCRERVSESVNACKGMPGAGVHLLGKPNYQGHAKVMLYPIGTFAGKESLLRSRLYIPMKEPGAVHLPTWATIAELEGLVSERLVSRLVKGRVVRQWVKVRDDVRNEPLDCAVLAHAGLHSFGLGFIAALGERATEIDELGKSLPDTQAEPKRDRDDDDRPRGGWMNAWR